MVSRQWCINLINTTKATFVGELKQIAAKHDDQFVKDVIKELEPQPTATPASSPTTAPAKEPSTAPQNNESGSTKTSVSMILGIIGIVFAWLFAIIGCIFRLLRAPKPPRLCIETAEIEQANHAS